MELKEVEQLFLDILSDPNKVSIDIGANIGCYTETMLKNKNITYSYEPVPELYEALENKFENQEILTIRNIALSDKTGKSLIHIPIVNGQKKYGWSSCYLDYVNEYPTKVVSVNTATLDSENIENVGLIKIDVEGFEQEVIKGGLQTIKEYMPNLIVELEERHRIDTIKDTSEILYQLGYEGLYIDLLNNTVKKFDSSNNQLLQEDFLAGRCSMYVYNFIFIAKERYDDIFSELMKRRSMIKMWTRMRSV